MRRVLVLTLLAVALPIIARADIIITNSAGSILLSGMAGTKGLGTIGTTVLTSQQSQLKQWNGLTGNLGYVGYSTGVLLSGSVLGGGTFAGGGSFDIFGVGKWAKKLTGAKGCGTATSCPLFTGSFSGPVAWTLTSPPGQTALTYALSGNLKGTMWTGRSVTGSTVQNINTYKSELVNGIGHITVSHGELNTPEPGTLGLLGTGLLAIAGIFRSKRMRS